MKIKTYIVDAFTDEPFKGNPAGVCLLDSSLHEDLMLSIARELGLSETAFLQKIEESKFSIRYFSPKMEIPLCGHATLASAKVLFNEGQATTIRFTTVQGLELVARKSGNQIEMEFPVYETESSVALIELVRALGLQQYTNCAYNRELKILLLETEDSDVLRNLQPDFPALLKSHKGINGVLVTAVSKQSNYDFESRYFWPWSGTNEDPVTGGTHTFLAKYWSKKLGKTVLRSFQCSERTGWMEVELTSSNNVIIRSNACMVLEGSMIV